MDLTLLPNSRDVAEAIINSDQWDKALRNTTYLPNGQPTTPLRKLIKKMPGAVGNQVQANYDLPIPIIVLYRYC